MRMDMWFILFCRAHIFSLFYSVHQSNLESFMPKQTFNSLLLSKKSTYVNINSIHLYIIYIKQYHIKFIHLHIQIHTWQIANWKSLEPRSCSQDRQKTSGSRTEPRHGREGLGEVPHLGGKNNCLKKCLYKNPSTWRNLKGKSWGWCVEGICIQVGIVEFIFESSVWQNTVFYLPFSF